MMHKLGILAALAAAAAAPPPLASQTHAEIDVPRGKAQKVIVQSRDFKTGTQTGWHIHPGTEVAFIANGRLELHTAGKVTVLEAGDSFTMPRGVPHNGINTAPETARAVVTLVVDKGAKPRQSVTAPKR